MRVLRFFIILSAIVIFVAGCQRTNRPKVKSVAELEQEIYGDTAFRFDEEKFSQLLSAYTEFAEKNPSDTLSPEYIFRAGQLAMSLGQYDKSLQLFARLVNKYPTFRKTPDAYFMMGFVYENNLNNLEKAGQIYREFMERYPTHEFADDAAVSLENLGKSPEELLKYFESLNQQAGS